MTNCKNRFSEFRFLICALVIFCFSISGCASFPGKELPTLTYQQLDRPTQKQSIDYDVRSPIIRGTVSFEDEVKIVFNRSDIFVNFHTGSGSERLHLSISFDYGPNLLGNTIVAIGSAIICGATFFILPGYANDDIYLHVDVKKDDQILKHYEYHDSVKTWFQLGMVFWAASNSILTVDRDVIDNMLLNFLHDFQKDNILQA